MQMLGMSYFFYELQRAGPLPPSQRMPWRGDSLKNTENGKSLDDTATKSYAGGYFDAGDFNKFMLPQAFSIARLAWGLHAFKDAHQKTFFDVCLIFCSVAPARHMHIPFGPRPPP
jgi:Glycosyl hydrolase family 9